jgi:hypothetical protein
MKVRISSDVPGRASLAPSVMEDGDLLHQLKDR